VRQARDFRLQTLCAATVSRVTRSHGSLESAEDALAQQVLLLVECFPDIFYQRETGSSMMRSNIW
jgi:hypothetical protein